MLDQPNNIQQIHFKFLFEKSLFNMNNSYFLLNMTFVTFQNDM
jgi:hypothetical protein